MKYFLVEGWTHEEDEMVVKANNKKEAIDAFKEEYGDVFEYYGAKQVSAKEYKEFHNL